MVFLLFLLGVGISFLGLEGQISSSLEDMPGPPPQLSTQEEREMAIVVLRSFSGLEGHTSSSLEDMP